QLHPEDIAENPVLVEKLRTLDTLRMSPGELVRNYPTPQMVRQMVNGQLPFPTDPDRKLMLTKLMERYEERQAKAGNDAQPPAPANVSAARPAQVLSPPDLRAFR